MKALLLPLVALLAGCASAPPGGASALPFHAFERRLYVAHASIPHLTPSEWESMAREFSARTDYEFRYAIRLEPGLVRVDLARKNNPENEGLSLFFERQSDRWRENPALSCHTVFLAHFHTQSAPAGPQTR